MRTFTFTTENTNPDFLTLLLEAYEERHSEEPVIPADDYDPFEDSRIDLDDVRTAKIAEKYGK